jgi:anthranilate/para-aminobenzoate synthase component I
VSLTGRSRYEQGVRRALGAIEAGDVYQVNLTHQLEGVFAGSARGLFAGLVRAARPWFGAYVELEGHAIASASPELFLRVDRQGLVTTRPMKGTRRDAHDLPELVVSEKERAELTMIVDLMRNDLGRVCTPGSVRPVGPRTIERHAGGGIYQATAQVQGRLAPGITLAQLLQATFPPGSVTGAPKLAAIKLARELEPTPRGLYCGAIGLVSNCGAAQFSVAIRTAHLTGPHTRGVFEPGSTLRYGVGAGLVADSVPRREWLETLDKAGVLRAALGHERRAVRAKGLGR